MPTSANDAAFWSCRAAEARAAAAQMVDPLSRSAILALAARYERLANRMERGVAAFGTTENTGPVIERSRPLKG
jgi:hypothetical protein